MLFPTANGADFIDFSLPLSFRGVLKRTEGDARYVGRHNSQQQESAPGFGGEWKVMIRAVVVRGWIAILENSRRVVVTSCRKGAKAVQWTGKIRERLIAVTIVVLLHFDSMKHRQEKLKRGLAILKERCIATSIIFLLSTNRIGQWCQKKYRSWRMLLKTTSIAATITFLLSANRIGQWGQKKFRSWRMLLRIISIAATITILLGTNRITQWCRRKFQCLRTWLEITVIAITITILLGTNRIEQWCKRKFHSWKIWLKTTTLIATITTLLAINSAAECMSSYSKTTSTAISSNWRMHTKPWMLASTISALFAVQWVLSAVQQLTSHGKSPATTTTTTTSSSSSPTTPLFTASAFLASTKTTLAAKASAVKGVLTRAPQLLPLYHERRGKHQSMCSLYMVFITSHRLERSRSDRSARLVEAAMYC
jgi:hypothetical protein